MRLHAAVWDSLRPQRASTSVLGRYTDQACASYSRIRAVISDARAKSEASLRRHTFVRELAFHALIRSEGNGIAVRIRADAHEAESKSGRIYCDRTSK
jgi:hypothetical protein